MNIFILPRLSEIGFFYLSSFHLSKVGLLYELCPDLGKTTRVFTRPAISLIIS